MGFSNVRWGAGSGDDRVSFDSVAVFLWVLAISLVLYIAFTSSDVELKVKCLLGTVLSVAGVVGCFSFGYVRLDVKAPVRWGGWLLWVLLCCMVIVFINIFSSVGAAVFRMAASWDIALAFIVSIAVFEDTFFRPFLLMWFKRMRFLPWRWMDELVSVGACSGAWTLFHFGVYGGDPLALLVVFSSGILLNYVVLYVKQISVTMSAHALINFLSMVTFALVMV